MIAILFAAALAQTPGATGITLGAIGRQSLPAHGCAAYLWSAADRRFVAMATADPATLRLSIDGKMVDLARSAQQGSVSLGLASSTSYVADDMSARLEMTIVPRENLTAGAQIPEGSLEISRAGQDGLIVPVAGLVGCTS